MSIFIKGMNKPKSCKSCFLRVCIDVKQGETVCEYNGLHIEDYDTPPCSCPIFNCSTNHGRLINENELCRLIVESRDLSIDEINKFTSIIIKTPTAVEAEG